MIAAVVPSAGHSQRMGRPKLILPIDGRTVIARVVAALRDGGAALVVVVAPPTHAPGAALLAREAADTGARVIVPESQPLDMRASVELALTELEQRESVPTTVLLTPADVPGLSPALVARVIERARAAPGSVHVPTVQGRRGHPVAIPWNIARHVRALPAGVGVNALIALQGPALVEFAIDDPAAVADLDTPDDYLGWGGDPDEMPLPPGPDDTFS